jgi:hypothetical protein
MKDQEVETLWQDLASQDGAKGEWNGLTSRKD